MCIYIYISPQTSYGNNGRNTNQNKAENSLVWSLFVNGYRNDYSEKNRSRAMSTGITPMTRGNNSKDSKESTSYVVFVVQNDVARPQRHDLGTETPLLNDML